MIENVDVVAAFLTAEMDGLVYATPTKSVRKLLNLKDDEVLELVKGLYGTKQAARLFWKEKDTLYKANGYKQTAAEPCLYWKEFEGEKGFVTTWVDDDTIFGSAGMIKHTKEVLKTKYEIDERGEMELLLGMHAEMDPSGDRCWCHLSSQAYCERMLKKFCPEGVKQRKTPLPPSTRYFKDVGERLDDTLTEKYRSIIGTLRHLAATTRPDIECAVNMLASFCREPRDSHLEGGYHILGYIANTMDYGLLFRKPGLYGKEKDEEEQIFVTTDSSFGSEEKGRSRSGFMVDIYGNPCIWGSRKTSTPAQSTTESELMAGNDGCREAVWAEYIMSEIDVKTEKPWTLLMDSKGAIKLAKNPVFSGRTKHIEIMYYYARELYEQGRMSPKYVSTSENKADALTKNLPTVTFQKHRKGMGVYSLSDWRSEITSSEIERRGGALDSSHSHRL